MSSEIKVNILPAPTITVKMQGGAGAGGDMFGPSSSTAGNLTSFATTSGKLLEDSGITKTSVSGHLAGTSNKHTGSVITNTPSGGVASTDVQSAINELDSDKLAKASNLSDLTNTTTARTNLGLGNSATLNTGTTAGTVATGDHNHSGVYEPANANIQSHISSTLNPHSVTKTQVGLGNVTDNAQVKKISSSVDNSVIRWDGITGDTPQGSLATIDDSGSVNIPSGQSYKINNVALTYTDVGAAPTANGVTNGNSHDHSGGDGAQINHTTLSNIGTNTHAQIDSHITSTENPHSTTLAQAATAGASTTVDITVGDIVNIGDGTDTDKTIYANNGDANKPAIKYDSTESKWQYSNDGSSYSDIGSSDATSIRGTVVSSTEPTNGQQLVYNSTSDQYEPTTPAGGGDMLAATYDPNNVNGDAFDMDNMVEGTTNKILTADERVILGNTSGSNTGDETTDSIKTKLGAATSTADGYLTSTDWGTFNGKVSGTIGNSSGNIVSRPADNTVGADTISEISSGVGVTADGVLLKDNDVQADEVRTDNIIEKTATNGVSIEGVIVKDSFLEMTEIAAPDSPAADKLRVYAKDSSGTTKLYTKDSAGTETELGAGGGGSTSDTSRGDSTWTSTTESPSQRAIEEALVDTALRYSDRVGASISSDHEKIVIRNYSDNGIDAYTMFITHADAFPFVDSSTNAYKITNAGATQNTTTKKFGAGSINIDGSSSSQHISASLSDATFGTSSPFTIDLWVYFSSIGTSYKDLLLNKTSDQAGRIMLMVDSSGYLVYNFYEQSSITSSSTVSTGSWHHVALVGDATNIKLYLDGTSVASAARSAGNVGSQDWSTLCIGQTLNKSNVTYLIDEVRVSNIARWSANFTPPTSAYSTSVVDNRLSDTKISDLNFGICQGRLTLESGVPVSTTDQTAKTTLYFTPYNGNRIATYDGTRWSVKAFAELSLSLSGYTADKNYDIWIYNNAGTLTLASTVWTDNTTRATALTTQDGIYVKSGATNYRYLGTIRTTATTGQCEDSIAKRFVWNYYNQVDYSNLSYDTTDSWTYNGNGTWRICNAAAACWKHEFVLGLAHMVEGVVHMNCATNNGAHPLVSVGFNATTPDVKKATRAIQGGAFSVGITASGRDILPEGYAYIAALESTLGAASALFQGDAGGAFVQSCFITKTKR